jgi:hypothetical protein
VNVANTELPPALLFQATEDAATPYPGGVRVHQLLARSSLVVEQGGGNHGITLGGNPCLDRYLSAYLADGRVPRAAAGAADAVCAKTADPKPRTGRAAASSPGSALHRLLGTRP